MRVFGLTDPQPPRSPSGRTRGQRPCLQRQYGDPIAKMFPSESLNHAVFSPSSETSTPSTVGKSSPRVVVFEEHTVGDKFGMGGVEVGNHDPRCGGLIPAGVW